MNIRIGLVGSPNSGKSTLFNWLTNSHSKTVNYPGSTVEVSYGKVAPHLGLHTLFLDTPGAYSLLPKSADEEVTLRALTGDGVGKSLDAVLVLVDGTHIERQMFLVEQVRQMGLPFAVVITMADMLRSQNIQLHIDALSQVLSAPVLLFDGVLAGGLREIADTAEVLPRPGGPYPVRPPSHDVVSTRAAAKKLAQVLFGETPSHHQGFARIVEKTTEIDRWALHPVFGFFIFVVIMGLLFTSIFWLAAPLMNLVDGTLSGLGDVLRRLLPETLWVDFLIDGVIASFSAVAVFAPQIFILFFGLALLEASGYLARAASLIDRPFSFVGLSGRSFVPILSGFSCAVPAMMATRNISSARDRWITNMIVPLMSCSARLPVYALLLAFLYKGQSAWKPGLVLGGLYLGSLLVGALVAGVINQFLPQKAPSLLMMELPLYRLPKFQIVFKQAFVRTMSYLTRSGPIIFTIAVLMWVATTFPQSLHLNPSQRIEQSYAGQLGQWIEPVVAPLGVDWRVGVGLITAFAAREVFVSTMAVTFNIADDDEATQQAGLLEQMSKATNPAGKLIFTRASVWGLIVFFMIALQCMSTFAVARRESGSWKFAILQLVSFNILAYIAAMATVRMLS